MDQLTMLALLYNAVPQSQTEMSVSISQVKDCLLILMSPSLPQTKNTTEVTLLHNPKDRPTIYI